jgi:hypothetical protein
MGQQDAIARLIAQLEDFRIRPGAYVRPGDVSHVEALLKGVDLALGAAGVVLDHAGVRKAHGFQESPLTVAQLLQVHGVESREIITQLIDLTIDALRRWSADHADESPA